MVDPIRVQRASLQVLSGGNFADGGQSADVNWVRIGSVEVLLYKRYLSEVVREDSMGRLTAMVEWRRSLSASDRAFLDERVAWVRHVVMDDGRVTGVLVPPAPDPFWRLDKGRPIPRDMACLTLAAHRAKKRSRDYTSIPQTVARLGHLLRTLSFLHSKNVTVGDLRLQNTLVSTVPQAPATYLIDCDAMLLRGVSALQAAEALTMRPDDIDDWPSVLNERTDCWKFASMAVACIGKNAALTALTDDVRRHLSSDHAEVLHDFLRFSNGQASARSLQTMADSWRRYVTTSGQERTRDSSQLAFVPWLGAPSCICETPTASPVRYLPVAPAVVVPATRSRVPAPIFPPDSGWLSAPTPYSSTPDPTPGGSRFNFWFVVFLVAIGVLIGVLLVLYELNS